MSEIGKSLLEEDIKKLGNEAFTKKDLKAAFAILSEIFGAATVMYALAYLMAILLGPLAASGAGLLACQFILMKCMDCYADLPKDQRKVIAKLCKELKRVL